MAEPFNFSAVPNPLTPLAYLEPDLARQVSISTYVLAGAIAVLIWDILNNLRPDYQLLTRFNIRLPTGVHIISRLASLGYVLASTMFETTVIMDCRRFQRINIAFYPIAMTLTTLLMFFRINAVYDRNIVVKAYFGFLWVGVIASSITGPVATTGVSIGPSLYCRTGDRLAVYAASAVIVPLVYVASVFVAICWRQAQSTHTGQTIKADSKGVLSGSFIAEFPKVLLRDGQACYLACIAANLVSVITLCVPGLPSPYRITFTIPSIALTNIMACRVYRNTMFGIFREAAMSTSTIVSSRDGDHIPLSFTRPSNNAANDNALPTPDARVKIHFQQPVERDHKVEYTGKMSEQGRPSFIEL